MHAIGFETAGWARSPRSEKVELLCRRRRSCLTSWPAPIS
jgi:hypothetical protein